MSTFDELRAELREHGELAFRSGRMLPLAAYHSDDLLALEHADLFGRDWLCVGRTADLPGPGDCLTAEIPAADGSTRSLIVVRADDGAIRVLDNVCIHRGAQLVAGCGRQVRLVCPYHAWTYRLDGSLIGAPHMGEAHEQYGEPFDPGRHRLVELRHEVWEGFVFVTQDEGAAGLSGSLSGLHGVVAAYDMAGYVPIHEQVDVWATNWKLLVENFMDAYHIFKVHKDSFGATGDTIGDTEMYPGTDHWAHHRVVESAGPEMAHEENVRLTGAWRKTVVLAAVFPGFVVQLQPDWMWFLRITPLGTDHVRIAWQVSVAPELLAALDDSDAYVADLMALIHLVNSEDQPIVEGVRRGVHRPQFARGPLSHLERNVYDFDRYVCRRLGTARNGAQGV